MWNPQRAFTNCGGIDCLNVLFYRDIPSSLISSNFVLSYEVLFGSCIITNFDYNFWHRFTTRKPKLHISKLYHKYMYFKQRSFSVSPNFLVCC